MKSPRFALPATLLALSVSFLAGSPSAWAEPGANEATTLSTGTPLGADRHTILYYNEHADGTWVRGKSYKARVNSAGFTYFPFLGSKAPRNYPVQFRLTSAALGGVELELTSDASITLESDRFTLDRGPVDVFYDMALESVEQSFQLDVAGAESDLVLELKVTSDLEGSKAGAGLAFRGPDGGVDYGAAIVFDGAGRLVDVPMTFDSGALRLTVPASFLSVAEGPVTVDPVVTTHTVDDVPWDLKNVDVSFDSSNSRNTYVYEDYFSAADADVYSTSFHTLTNQILVGSYIDQSALSWVNPKVANIDVLDQSLIVASEIALTGTRSVVGCFYDDNTGLAGAAIAIATPPQGESYWKPVVGGDNNRTATSPQYLVGWDRTTFIGQAISVGARTVSPSGSLGTVTTPVGVGTGWGLAIAQSNSSMFGLQVWNIAYGFRATPSSTPQIGMGTINSSGWIETNGIIHTVAPGVFPYDFDISESISAGGFAYKHLISYDEDPEPDTSTKRLLLCSGTNLIRAIDLNEMEHGPSNMPAHGIRLATTWTPPLRPEFLVAYHQDEPGGTTGIYMTTLDSWGSNHLAISEHRTRVATSNPYSLFGDSLALTSRASGAYHSQFSMLAWTRDNPNNATQDIYAATHQANRPDAVGQQFCVGVPNSTGQRGFLACYGTTSTTASKTLTASKLPTNSLALYIAGQGTAEVHQPGSSVGVLCISGSALGRYTNQAVSTGSTGTANLVVDPMLIPAPWGTSHATAGQVWNFQLWHRDIVGGLSVSNFTNAVGVRFE